MNTKVISTLTTLCFCVGFLVYIFKAELIIIRGFNQISIPTARTLSPCHKKNVQLYWYNNGAWHKESSILLWSNNNAQDSFQLIQQWLVFLYEEKIISKKVTLQSALVSANETTVYLSFDRTFFDKEASINQKCLLVQALLKTLQENNLAFQAVQFLVHHKPLNDPHLDFSKPWPAQGFLE